jgi:MarR family transcriptional regulator, multiple gene regulator MgrA
MKLIIDRFLKHILNLPEQHKMLVSISYSHDMINKHFETILEKYSLSPSQYNLLRILQGKHPQPCNVLELKDEIINKKSDVSRLVERLRKNGLVDRQVKEADRRSVQIVITEKGLQTMERIKKEEQENMFGPFSHITDDEAKQLNIVLQKLLEGLKEVKV